MSPASIEAQLVLSAGVGDGGVGVGSTVPLHGVRDSIASVAFTLLANGLVEENICLSNNLLGELEERSSPFADLSLELQNKLLFQASLSPLFVPNSGRCYRSLVLT